MNSSKLTQEEIRKIDALLLSGDNIGLLFFLMYGRVDIAVGNSYATEKKSKIRDHGYQQVNELDTPNFEAFRSRLTIVDIPSANMLEIMGFQQQQQQEQEQPNREILREVDGYQVNQWDIIKSPGKFEGELWYIPRLWDLTLENFEDEIVNSPHSDFYFSVFFRENLPAEITEQNCGIEEKYYAIVLWEDNNGFVHSDFLSRAEYEKWKKEIENCPPIESPDISENLI